MNSTTDTPTHPAPTAAAGRLRVALLITDIEVGGAERALVELARRLPPESFDVRVWSLLDPPAEPTRSLVPVLDEACLPVTTLGARGKRDTLRVIRRLSAEWRAWRPDIVQTFLFHANFVGRIAARRARVPRVVAGIRVAERRRRAHLLLDRLTAPLVDRWVCVSRAVADFSHRAGGLPPGRLIVIPNGIDTSRYDASASAKAAAAAAGLPDDRRWVIYVGRLDEQKGLEPFLTAAPAWLSQHPAHDVLLVGDGPLRGRLEAVVSQRGLSERVRFLGWRGDVPRLLSASDLLVLPSRWEGMPNVILEAMAAGRPVLASDVEGVRELLGDSAAPQVASNASEWNEKIARLLGDSQLAAELGAANRRRAEDHFTLDAVARAYAALYESLTGPRGAPAGQLAFPPSVGKRADLA